ncbi:hypothetical protein D0864_15496 [Hortaea werneckii]|uniref:Uncharacterized protein n=1 Tax=Hortaea werneckii TaxID=91943 RepID=A0A3M7C021_HORWE|nr:hypothetical protein D0864_15496 [Hortaea werneckii]
MSLAFADKRPGYFSNTKPAERVEDLLKFYGLAKWGFIVYRCTYGGDARWARFMTRLNTRKDHLLREVYHKPKLEDLSLDGATRDGIRRRFREWENFKAEIPNGLDEFKEQFLMRENPRYNSCIHVDSDAMESVTPRFRRTGRTNDRLHNYDESEPEVEGSRLYDVGWMMVDATSLVPAAYSTFIKSSSWDRLYCRPPKILER